jgi:hypothetical protein
MKAAVDQVINCRTVLKYSYILGFYLCSDISNYSKIKDSCPVPLETLDNAKQLFEYQQEMLEKNTELLSELTEEYCNNLYKYTEDYMYGGSGSKPGSAASSAFKGAKQSSSEGNDADEPLSENIIDKRDHIINLTRITEKFMNHLLASIGTDGNVSRLLVAETGEGAAGGMPASMGALRSESENEYYEFMIQQTLLESTVGASGGGSSSGHADSMDIDAELASSSSSSSSSSAAAAVPAGQDASSRSDTKRTGSGGILNAFWSSLNPAAAADTGSSTGSARAKRSISGAKK